ncbi:hypothetical protein UA19_00339 [Burkholderia multivorans]|nr:penicillin-binding 6, Serine peptidase, MEROPS family S11 domain protein [Burkholderia multivorans ATCC BAA-247]SAK12519.1 hypothetical protein UA21_00340 [Burkholderia multivorans]SAK12530.1 hypothetical protein UA19_00339 [Burkholderia multivorans]SPU79443.1 Uncharacterised protein [Burkholderia multivorans]
MRGGRRYAACIRNRAVLRATSCRARRHGSRAKRRARGGDFIPFPIAVPSLSCRPSRSIFRCRRPDGTSFWPRVCAYKNLYAHSWRLTRGSVESHCKWHLHRVVARCGRTMPAGRMHGLSSSASRKRVSRPRIMAAFCVARGPAGPMRRSFRCLSVRSRRPRTERVRTSPTGAFRVVRGIGRVPETPAALPFNRARFAPHFLPSA